MRTPRTIAQWVEILGKADATNCSEAAAMSIIHGVARYHRTHVKDLANALQAYAYLLQEHGVKVVL